MSGKKYMGTYKDSGVDWKKGEHFIQKVLPLIQSTYTKEVYTGVGGYAALYSRGNGNLLAASTDGVGTKIKIAQMLQTHHTIGIDLVAMCANDIICTGARPLFFLDYILCESLDIPIQTDIIKGISQGCLDTGMALIGGETAEHPNCFPKNEYDISGFCVGEVQEKELITGKTIQPKDALICLPSSGLHSNGFSLVRKLIDSSETKLLKECLTPTTLYVKEIVEVQKAHKGKIKGLAHITGSGFHNIRRMNTKVGYEFHSLPPLPGIFTTLSERAKISSEELYSTFNMGVGMVIAVSPSHASEIIQSFEKLNRKAYLCGEVSANPGEILVKARGISFTLMEQV